MKSIKELVPLIHQWATERDIFDKSTAFDQLLKTHEEVGELIKACYDNDRLGIRDAIGDVMVTLINYCHFIGEDFETIANYALTHEIYENIPRVQLAIFAGKLTMKMLNKEYKHSRIEQKRDFLFEILYIVKYLDNITTLEHTTLEACLNLAYNVIKERTGKIINGKFIKDENKNI